MSITLIRTPSVTRKPYVDDVTVSLTEFQPEEIAEYLRGLGYSVDGTFSRHVLDAIAASKLKTRRRINDDDDDPEYEEGAFILASDLSIAGTLALCGQRDAAREHILGLVSEAMGRPL